MQKNFKHYVLAAMLLLAPMAANAQVTVGNGNVPKDFSVLELISNDERGLRLPQMTTDQRTIMEGTKAFKDEKTGEAMGLQIFNTDTHCVETWNGTKWISQCAMCGDTPCVYYKFKCSAGNVFIPQFMAYNLGADSLLNTPKKQMKYLSEKRQEANYDFIDARVFGGFYQWGRAGRSYAMTTDGTFRRYWDNGLANKQAHVTNKATYDENGQLLTYNGVNSADGIHISGSTTTDLDWAYYQDNETRNALWGNGRAVGTATDDIRGGVLYEGNTYQSPVKTVNDPCPAGWRIPTQEEWESIGDYDCNSSFAGGSFTVSKNGVHGALPDPASPFFWVPVVCSGSGCTVSNTWAAGELGADGTYSGYAVYKKEDWEAFPGKTGDLTADNAPEPFLFLPTAGFRGSRNGTVYYVGRSGFYWSSSISDTQQSYCFAINNTTASPRNLSDRANGFSVRCVAE